MSNIRYSPDADVLSIRLSNEPTDHGEDCGQIIVHLSAQDKPVGLEVLEASEFVRDLLKAMVDRGPEFSKVEFSVELHLYDVVKKLMDDIKGHANIAKQQAN